MVVKKSFEQFHGIGALDLKLQYLTINISIFEVLRDLDLFKNFSLDSWVLILKNELDLAPEYLCWLLNKKTTSVG